MYKKNQIHTRDNIIKIIAQQNRLLSHTYSHTPQTWSTPGACLDHPPALIEVGLWLWLT